MLRIINFHTADQFIVYYTEKCSVDKISITGCVIDSNSRTKQSRHGRKMSFNDISR